MLSTSHTLKKTARWRLNIYSNSLCKHNTPAIHEQQRPFSRVSELHVELASVANGRHCVVYGVSPVLWHVHRVACFLRAHGQPSTLRYAQLVTVKQMLKKETSPQRRGCICFALALQSGRGRVNRHSTANLPLPPACALPSTARGCYAGHAGQRGRRCSSPVQSQRHTPGPSARCCGLQHHQRAACPCAPALHPQPLLTLPLTISFTAWRACTPVTRIQHECSATPCLSPPQRSTRGVAPRNNTAQAAEAAMNLFQKTNKT
jgi:hypothetical protein